MPLQQTNKQSFLTIAIIVQFLTFLAQCKHENFKNHSMYDSLFKHKSSLTCKIPLHIDPWNPSAKEFYKSTKLECPKGPLLTYVNQDGILTKASEYAKYSCKYALMKRVVLDRKNVYTDWRVLPLNGVKLTNQSPFATTTCYDVNGKLVYANTHLRVPDFRTPRKGDTGPSVFVLVLESLSRLSFYRFLTKTKQAMDQLGNFQILAGLTKVGRNSFPNSFAFLTGIPMNDEQCQKVGVWDKKFRYLWDDFKENGYLTAFVEDVPWGGLFSYYGDGWLKPPTDWYPTPFWINMHPSKVTNWPKTWKSLQEYCYAAVGKKSEIFMQQLTEFAHKMRKVNQTYFMYSFYSQSIHNDFDRYPFIDKAIAELIKNFVNQIDSTVLILMGDHGTMWGNYARKSTVGHLEGSLPFFAIRVPEKLHQRHPHLRKYLNMNHDRLLSWWDIREMVLDVARGTYEKQLRPKATILSPWRSLVPNWRTCQDANISLNWCVCNGILGPKPGGQNYKVLAKEVVGLLNKRLRNSNCSKFQLVKFHTIQHILLSENEELASKEQISLFLEVFPGQFRAQVLIQRKRVNIKKAWLPWKLLYFDEDTLKERCIRYHENFITEKSTRKEDLRGNS